MKSVVTPAEVRAYYNQNLADYKHPETYLIQTISVFLPEKATDAQVKEGRKRAEEECKKAKAAKTAEQFGLLAEKVSDDDYRVMLGQHKPIDVKEMAPQVLKTLQAMKPGDVSDVVEVGNILTIMRLNAHEMPGAQKFEEVSSKLTNDLRQKKTNQVRSALDQKLRKGAKIEVL